MRLKVNCAPNETGSFSEQAVKRSEPATESNIKEKYDSQIAEGLQNKAQANAKTISFGHSANPEDRHTFN